MGNKLKPEIRFQGFSEDWEQRKLSDIKDVRDGTHDSPKYYNEGFPLVTSKNLTENGLDITDVSLISEEDFHSINKRSKVDIGDIIFGMIGTIGNPVIVDREGFAIKNVALIKHGGEVTNKFLIQLLKSPVFSKYIRNENAGNTQKFLGLGKIRGYQFLSPIYDEQTKIGNFFKQLDDTIALHQQELTTLKQTKQGFLQKMFPKEGETVPEIRFPGFTGEWIERKVMDFSEETFGGGTPKTSIKEYWSGEIPWIQSSDLQEHNVLDVFPTKKITEKGLQNSATKLIPKNSIAIVTRVGVGKIAFIKFEYATSQDFLSLVNLKVNEWFGVYSLYNLLQKEGHNVQGTSIKGITKNELLDKKINIPSSLEEQKEIGEFFKRIDQTIALHQRELEAQKETKKAFLQKMFV